MNVNPDLKKMAPANSAHDYQSLNCAECDAMDKSMNGGIKNKDMAIRTVGLDVRTGRIYDKERCNNCKITTDRAKITSG